MYIQGVQEKLRFSLSPAAHPSSPIYRWRFSKLSTQIVQSLLANFCTTNSSPVLARERWQHNKNSWKKTFFPEHPVCAHMYLMYICTYIYVHIYTHIYTLLTTVSNSQFQLKINGKESGRKMHIPSGRKFRG